MGDEMVAQLKVEIKTLYRDVEELKKDIKDIKYQLANRLPLWATFLISFLTGTIGWLLSK